MKYYKSILITLAIVTISTSCSEDFLNLSPQDAIASSQYWKSTGDLEIYANQFYTAFPVNSGYWTFALWFDVNSDNMITSRSQNRTFEGTRTVPGSGAGWDFSDIRSVNFFLENYSTVESDPSEYNHYVGEIYFFRAYFYFEKLVTFGDCPIIDKTLDASSEELFYPRDARNDVADFIIADLDKAIELMVSGVNSNGNRLNKEIALLFKARVALYEGTWEKYHANTAFGVSGSDGTQYLQIAAEAAEALIDGGVYSIVPYSGRWTYKNLFGQGDFLGNPEIMLWKQFDFALGLNTANAYFNYRGFVGAVGITKSLVDSYLCIDGRPISTSALYLGDDSTAQVVANRDPRLEQTIFVRGHPFNVVAGDTVKRFTVAALDASGYFICPTGYQNFKALNWTFEDTKGNTSITASTVFRYAEALLSLAEAKAELGTITQGDLDKTINLLRDRVKMPHLILTAIENDPNWDYPSLSPIINEVRRERRVELAVEGYRLDDLLRWRAHEVFVGTRPLGAKFVQSDYPTLTPGVNVTLTADGYVDYYLNAYGEDGWSFNPDRDYLAPLPTNELTLNVNLVQNPGW